MQRWIIILWCLVWGLPLGMLHAQTDPLQPGENTIGELTPSQPFWETTILATTSTTQITVQSITADFAPLFLVYNANDTVLARRTNPTAQAEISLTLATNPDSTYRLQVLGVDGQSGQFVVELTEADTDPIEAETIRSGQQVEGRVSRQTPMAQYTVISSAESGLTVQVSNALPNGHLSVVLQDDANRPLATLRTPLSGAAFFIPAGVDVAYQVWILHDGTEQAVDFVISVQATGVGIAAPFASPTPTATRTLIPTQANLTPTASPTPPIPTTTDPTTTPPLPQATLIPPSTPPSFGSTPTIIAPTATVEDDNRCVAISNAFVGSNVRQGPSADFDVIGGIGANVPSPIIGRTDDSAWWLVEYRPGQFGWVAEAVIERRGDCSTIEVATPTP